MRWLYNHELLHRWIGRTIINENEVEQYWFSEGFTDYYTYKLMLRSGSIDAAEFVNILNKEVLIPHMKDPLRNLSNSEITFETYWGQYARFQKLPYRRGLLYAFNLDNQIKSKHKLTKSLDDLIKEIFQQALENPDFRFNHQVFHTYLLKYLGEHAWTEFQEFIVDGNLINFEESLPESLEFIREKKSVLFSIRDASKQSSWQHT